MNKMKTKIPSCRQQRNALYRVLHQNQVEQGLKPKETPALPNHKSYLNSPEEELAARQEMIEA
ncbi:hypothetical protein JCM15765_09670 [Paradesulfitobacterium aromaticivorans]